MTNNEHKEIYKQLYKSINVLIEHGTNVNIGNNTEKTALFYTLEVKFNQKELVELLIKNGANVNEIDNQKITPLMYAAKNCNVEIIELLRDNGAVMDYIDENRLDAIDYAIIHNETNVVKTLLEIDKFKFQQPLEKTIENGILKNYREYYISHSKKITCNEKGYKLQDSEGNTYLMRALERGNREIIELILSHFDYNEYLTLKNFKTGRNVLHEAVLLNNKEMVELLISKKMNLNEQDGTGSIGYTALMHACSYGNKESIEIANLLIDSGADVTLINYQKESALSLISKRITFELYEKWEVNPKLIELYDKLNSKLKEILEYRKTHKSEINNDDDGLPF